MYQENDTTIEQKTKGCSNLPPAWFCSGNQSLGDVQVKAVDGVLYGEVEKAINNASGRRRKWQEHHPKFPERWVPLLEFEAELEKGVAPKPLRDQHRSSARDTIALATAFSKEFPQRWQELYADQLVSWGTIEFWRQ